MHVLQDQFFRVPFCVILKVHKRIPNFFLSRLDSLFSGKLGVKVSSFKASKNLSKAQRKNMVNQIRSHKQEQILEKERMEGGAN